MNPGFSRPNSADRGYPPIVDALTRLHPGLICSVETGIAAFGRLDPESMGAECALCESHGTASNL